MAGGRRSEPSTALGWFIHSEVAGSAALVACTVAAMLWANSRWAELYFGLAHTPIAIAVGPHALTLSLRHWINDGLMAVFFFVVGLEIKRELTVGHLSSVRQAVLPVAAAIGGMAVPALLYVALNAGGPGAGGWAIPMATDIAFALGVLALLGDRVPAGLKVFLTALAIADDLGAVLVIALFYTQEIRWAALAGAATALVLLALVARTGLRRPISWAVLVAAVWLAVLLSGIHATVAGILVAMVVPVRPRLGPSEFLATATEAYEALRRTELTRDSVLADEAQLDALTALDDAATDMRPPGLVLERFLHPLQAFLILPLFALVNAGVQFGESRVLETLRDPVALGVIAGLGLGKVAGISLATGAAVASRAARLPEGITWGQIAGAGLLGGIGFTMSLFVSELAFEAEALLNAAKVGILTASLASGALGYLVLRAALPRR
jgi:NhaA family Na+:H+ antiporter